MVSFQEPNSSRTHGTIQEFLENNSSEKKRRWEDKEGEKKFENESKLSKFDHLERRRQPSTLYDLNRSLDTQSEKVNLYNKKNQQKITYKEDPSTRQSQERRFDIEGPMSLDLELNLPYDHQPLLLNDNSNSTSTTTTTSMDSGHDRRVKSKKGDGGALVIKRCPSWMSFEEDQKEMVAMGCMRCHMLVMLDKTSPSCPNCKFMHPPDHQSSVNFFLTQGLVP